MARPARDVAAGKPAKPLWASTRADNNQVDADSAIANATVSGPKSLREARLLVGDSEW
jgi:hypothetical protein